MIQITVGPSGGAEKTGGPGKTGEYIEVLAAREDSSRGLKNEH
jgi:hypothetical protein